MKTRDRVENQKPKPRIGAPSAVALGLLLVPLVVLAFGGWPLAFGQGTGQPAGGAGQTGAPGVRQIGVVAQIAAGSLTLRTDAGAELNVQLPPDVAVVRVPPGSKDLKAATKISLSDLNTGDRVLVRGVPSDDEKSVIAKSVIVMTRADIASAHDAERLEWQRHGLGGLVKSVDPAAKELLISIPNTPPTPGNPTHPLSIAVAPSATVLRYALDSVRFSDATPASFEDIKVGDQVRALGTMNEDRTKFTATKLVSGSFRNIAATVISVNAAEGSVLVKDLATGKPVLVKTGADSRMHVLPPMVAAVIAMLNSGQGVGANGGAQGGQIPAGGGQRPASAEGNRGGMAGRFGAGGGAGGGQPRDFNQMLDRTPTLSLSDLKPGDAVIAVSTEGAKPSEVTAIVLLSGVEPILAARPKGSNEVNLGSWTMGGGAGEDTGP